MSLSIPTDRWDAPPSLCHKRFHLHLEAAGVTIIVDGEYTAV
jgi:hypothetical protein